MNTKTHCAPQNMWMKALTCAWLMTLWMGFGGCNKTVSEPASDKEESAINVRTHPVQLRDIEETIEGIGRTETLPDHLAMLTPALEGHVHKIVASLGAKLKTGDLIVEFDPTAPAADLAEKISNRDALKSQLQLLIAPPRIEDRKILELAIEQATIAVERTVANLERLKPLRAKQEISEAQIFEADKAVAQAKVQKQAAEAQLNLRVVGPPPEAIGEAKAKLAAAEQSVEHARNQLALYSLRSPIDGVLDNLNCRLGQTIAPGTVLGEVVDTSQLLTVVFLSPGIARKIRVSQKVSIDNKGLELQGEIKSESDKSKTIEIPGIVQSISQIADAQTGRLQVRILVENREQRLAVGQTVNVKIVIETHKNKLVVPVEALADLGEGMAITVVRDGKTKILKPTSTVTYKNWATFSGIELNQGEPVVIDGHFNLPDETKVKIEQPKSNESEGKHE